MMIKTRWMVLALCLFCLGMAATARADDDPVFARVRQVLVETLHVDPAAVTPDSSLDGLGMTHSNQDDVKRNLETEFGIVISDDEFGQMKRVLDVVRFFKKKMEEEP